MTKGNWYISKEYQKSDLTEMIWPVSYVECIILWKNSMLEVNTIKS